MGKITTKSMTNINKGKFIKNNFVIIAFFIIFVFSCFATPVFLTINNITTVLIQNSIYTICALGMLMIIITGGIDLSVGSYVCICVCLTAGFIQNGMGVTAIIAVSILSMLFGCVTGILVAYAKVAPFIVTLAMTSILKGLAYMYQVGESRRIDGTFWPEIIQGSIMYIPTPIFIMIVVFLVVMFILNKTKFGRGLYAIGGNAETARLAGVNVRKYLVMVYALGGFLFGLAGMILAGRLSMGTATVGDGYELDAIASVVIGGALLSGGKGSAVKTMVGAFLMGILLNVMNLLGIASYPQMVFKGIIIVVAVLANRND